jgi:hypothetical protein
VGFSPQRPIKKAHQQDPREVREWLGKTFLSIRKLARQAGGFILFADESVQHTENFAKIILPQGPDASGRDDWHETPDERDIALSNAGLMRSMTYSGTMNCRVLIRFVRNLLRSIDTLKVFLSWTIFAFTTRNLRKSGYKSTKIEFSYFSFQSIYLS